MSQPLHVDSVSEEPPSLTTLSELLQARALKATGHAIQELSDINEAYCSVHARLTTELAILRDSVHAELNAAASLQKANIQRLERAARALTVRAMQLDNRALEIDIRERAVVDAQTRHHTLVTQREQDFRRCRAEIDRKEQEILAKEASLKYSTLQQAHLHQWSNRLEKRENETKKALGKENERISTRLAKVVDRELLAAEKERHFETACQRREEELKRREAAAELLADALQKQRKEAADQIQRERTQFWKHQQKLSAVVSREIDALLTEQAKLRHQFEQDATATSNTLRAMAKAVDGVKSSLRESP
ncbi:unnamed protein product [Agarophyton chilense]